MPVSKPCIRHLSAYPVSVTAPEQKKCENRVSIKKKQKLEERKVLIRAQDMKNGILVPACICKHHQGSSAPVNIVL